MPDDEDLADTLFSFIDKNARMWGGRLDVATKVGCALLELMESGFSFEIFKDGATVTFHLISIILILTWSTRETR